LEPKNLTNPNSKILSQPPKTRSLNNKKFARKNLLPEQDRWNGNAQMGEIMQSNTSMPQLIILIIGIVNIKYARQDDYINDPSKATVIAT
jgi:hypothetical protein